MYDRLRTIEKEKVLSAIGDVVKKRISSKRTLFDGLPLKLTTLRMMTFFEDGTTCHCCGLEAAYFAIERNASEAQRNPGTNYHLNLWGIDQEGEEVLFTHDHTLARALGGKDDRSNTKTMCTKCNFEKSLTESEILRENRRKS